MIKEKLLSLLKREYGDGSEELLKELMDANDIENLQHEKKSKLRNLARDIRNSLPNLSFAKRNIVFSEILKILKLDVLDIGKEKVEEEEIDRTQIENKKVDNLVKDIEKSLIKYETVFNLFWLRAGEAELEGIKHEDVLKTTQKALIGIKKDLEKSRDEIFDEFKKIEHRIKKQNRNIQFKEKNYFEHKINENNEKELKEKKIHKEIFDKFWNNIEIQYDKFKKIFIESLEKEIQLRKEGKDDTLLIQETKNNMITVWSEIEKSYKKFEKDMKEANQKLYEQNKN